MIDDKSHKNVQINSPCIRNCCLDDNDICVGCHRHLDEITGWHSMSEQQKILTLEKCHQRNLPSTADVMPKEEDH